VSASNIAALDIADTRFWERYDQYRNPEADIGIRNDAYQQYSIRNPSGAARTRSMLTTYEISLLYALAREYYTGAGEILDLGPLNGVCSNALCKGLIDNPRPLERQKRIFAFDLFLTGGLPAEIFGTGADVTGSFLDAYLTINRDYLGHIHVSAGDLLGFRWPGDRPVEIVFNDISKSWALNTWIQRNVLPALIPGQSILIQQDYVYFHSYWVAITMQYYAEYFERLYPVFGSSMVYRYRRRLPAAEFDRNLADLPLHDKIALLDDAIEGAETTSAQVLRCARAFCLFDHGEFARAEEALQDVDLDAKGQDPINDFSGIARSNRDIVAHMIHARRRA
jgi:hypothetical protein